MKSISIIMAEHIIGVVIVKCYVCQKVTVIGESGENHDKL